MRSMTLKVLRCVDIPLNISSDLRQRLGDSEIRSSAYQLEVQHNGYRVQLHTRHGPLEA